MQRNSCVMPFMWVAYAIANKTNFLACLLQCPSKTLTVVPIQKIPNQSIYYHFLVNKPYFKPSRYFVSFGLIYQKPSRCECMGHARQCEINFTETVFLPGEAYEAHAFAHDNFLSTTDFLFCAWIFDLFLAARPDGAISFAITIIASPGTSLHAKPNNSTSQKELHTLARPYECQP